MNFEGDILSPSRCAHNQACFKVEGDRWLTNAVLDDSNLCNATLKETNISHVGIIRATLSSY
jgi:hypothetical protein